MRQSQKAGRSSGGRSVWGLLIWKEFQGGDGRAKAFAGLMLVLFAAGLAFFSFAAESVK